MGYQIHFNLSGIAASWLGRGPFKAANFERCFAAARLDGATRVR
jgi:hypothetical protein